MSSVVAMQMSPPAERRERAAGHLLASAEQLHQQLLSGLSVWSGAHGAMERRGTPKLIAVVALALESRRLVRRPRAILLAAEAVAQARGMTRGAQKKAASEARALVAHALAEGRVRIPQAESDAELLERLDALLAPINLQDALLARAAEHAGAKGGRPARAAGEVCAELRRLMALADAGDPSAFAELLAVSRQLQAWTVDVLGRAARSV